MESISQSQKDWMLIDSPLTRGERVIILLNGLVNKSLVDTMGQRGRPGKRDVVLRAAREQFLALGFDATSIDSVAALAGVSKPTIYAHFPTKEALLEAVVRTEAGQITPAVELPVTDDPRRDLQQAALLLLTASLDLAALAWDRMMAGEARRSPMLGKLFHEAGPGRVHSIVTDFFQRINKSGTLRIPDPNQAADFFFGMVIGTPLLRAQLTGQILPKAKRAARAEAVAEHFVRAYSANG